MQAMSKDGEKKKRNRRRKKKERKREKNGRWKSVKERNVRKIKYAIINNKKRKSGKKEKVSAGKTYGVVKVKMLEKEEEEE